MTVTLTYDSSLARVRIDANGLGSAPSAQVERSTDQLTWKTVRGGLAVDVVGGVMTTLDDYEFQDSEVNYYRVVYADTISYVASGTAAHAAGADVTPGLPPGATTGDLLLIWTATRQSALGVPQPPTGYTQLANMGNAQLFGKIHDGSESNPTITIVGPGGATMSFSAQMAAFRNASLNVHAFDHILTLVPSQNILYPALPITENGVVALGLAWRQDDYTTFTSPFGTEIGEFWTTLGNDQGMAWVYEIQTTAQNINAGEFTVTGGITAVNRGGVVALSAETQIQSSSITPLLDGVWLKSLGRPFLNRRLTCVGNPRMIERQVRNTTFDVVGQSLPSGVSELAESRTTTIPLTFRTTQDRVDFNIIIGTGDPLFFHTPTGYPLPTMYVVVGDTEEQRPVLNRRCNDDWRRFVLPLQEVAAPGASVVGNAATWTTVINTYDTWQDVIDAHASWLELLELVGSIGEVIVS